MPSAGLGLAGRGLGLAVALVMAVAVALSMTACASRSPLPTAFPVLDGAVRMLGQTPDRSALRLLVLQQEGPALRFVLMDPLGVPLARQTLSAQGWHADGLLPPNPQARTLFSALLFSLLSEQQLPQLARFYPDEQLRSEPAGGLALWRDAQQLWRINPLPDGQGWQLDFPAALDGAKTWYWCVMDEQELASECAP